MARCSIPLRIACYALAVMLCGIQWGCVGETGVVTGFECKPSDNGDDGCDNDKICQNGKCVKVDKDKDGWAQGKDCNDDSPFVYPGAVEICDNQVDDNCNGKTDETPCDCKEGSERPCGPATKGICKQGIQRCKNGVWGTCEGQIQPTNEECDGLDNDCNGKIDDNLQGSCYAGPDGTAGKGACTEGQRRCEGGKWGQCEGQVLPTNEECNGKDDDCDGFVDKDLKRSCYDGPDGTKDIGACQAGLRNCEQGTWTACMGQVTPSAKETCDNKIDDNCNGQVDEGCVARLFEVKSSINTDTGELDGVPYSKFSQGTFELPSFRIPANTRVTVTGKNPLYLKVAGQVELLGTLDVSGPHAKDINCQTTAAEIDLLGRAGVGVLLARSALSTPAPPEPPARKTASAPVAMNDACALSPKAASNTASKSA